MRKLVRVLCNILQRKAVSETAFYVNLNTKEIKQTGCTIVQNTIVEHKTTGEFAGITQTRVKSLALYKTRVCPLVPHQHLTKLTDARVRQVLLATLQNT